MKSSELQDFLVSRLVLTVGGTQRRWRMAIGPVRILDEATHPHCNWSVTPSGAAREIAEIETVLDIVRLDHPFVTAG